MLPTPLRCRSGRTDNGATAGTLRPPRSASLSNTWPITAPVSSATSSSPGNAIPSVRIPRTISSSARRRRGGRYEFVDDVVIRGTRLPHDHDASRPSQLPASGTQARDGSVATRHHRIRRQHSPLGTSGTAAGQTVSAGNEHPPADVPYRRMHARACSPGTALHTPAEPVGAVSGGTAWVRTAVGPPPAPAATPVVVLASYLAWSVARAQLAPPVASRRPA